jgi:hypothetical protein
VRLAYGRLCLQRAMLNSAERRVLEAVGLVLRYPVTGLGAASDAVAAWGCSKAKVTCSNRVACAAAVAQDFPSSSGSRFVPMFQSCCQRRSGLCNGSLLDLVRLPNNKG